MRDRELDGRGSVGLAIFLILFGVALLAQQQGWWGAGWTVTRVWPIGFILWGGARMLDGARRGRWNSGGFWLLVIGGWFLLDQLDILRAGRSWPIVVVAVGVSILMRDRWERPRNATTVERPDAEAQK